MHCRLWSVILHLTRAVLAWYGTLQLGAQLQAGGCRQESVTPAQLQALKLECQAAIRSELNALFKLDQVRGKQLQHRLWNDSSACALYSCRAWTLCMYAMHAGYSWPCRQTE